MKIKSLCDMVLFATDHQFYFVLPYKTTINAKGLDSVISEKPTQSSC